MSLTHGETTHYARVTVAVVTRDAYVPACLRPFVRWLKRLLARWTQATSSKCRACVLFFLAARRWP
jgi:hypothetical protein